MIDVLEPVKLSSHQFFLQWFAEACERAGFRLIQNPSVPWKARQIAAKLKICRTVRRGSPVLVPCGGFPDSVAFPVGYWHEIVPVMWDTWPRYHARIEESLRRYGVRLAFFTQRQVAEMMAERIPGTRCVWLPEGLNPEGYKCGRELKDRGINLLELGRLMPRFHDAVVGSIDEHLFMPPEQGLLFKDFEALTTGLSDAKLTVSFPRCDTNPEHAGNIETMTQRYWESMFSRTLIVGHAPRELIDFMGYNPCVEIEWGNPKAQIRKLIDSIGDYQALVDRNYEFAIKNASWDSRMSIVVNSVNEVLV